MLGSQLVWRGDLAWQVLRTLFSGIGQMIVAKTAWILLMRILASVGSEAVAAATIAIRLMMCTVAVSVLFFLFPRELMGIFTGDARIVAIGAEWLRILSYSYFHLVRAHTGMFWGVFWGVFVSETTVGLSTLWSFSRGRWQTTQV